MATRQFFCQGATANGTALGGTREVAVDAGYVAVLQPEQDGLEDSPDVDRLIARVAGSLSGEDVTKFLTVLNSTPSELSFHGRESGLTTYGKGIVDDPKFLGGSLNIARSGEGAQYASMSLNWQAVGAAADELDDIFQLVDAQTEPTYTDAARLIDPTAMVHGAQTILHPAELSVNVQPVGVNQAWGDGDVAVTEIDVAGHRITGTIGFTDSTEKAGPPTHELAIALVKAARGTLAVTVRASRGAAAKTVTLYNCAFTKYLGRFQSSQGHWVRRLNFVLGRLDDDGTTKRTLGGASPIMSIA